VNLKEFWLDNKKFLLAVGGALVVFFTIGDFAAGFVEDADLTRKKSGKERRELIGLHKDLRNSFWVEQAKVEHYEKQEAELKKALCMPEVTELDGGNVDQLRVKFDQAISRVWQAVQQDANRAGIRLPPPISSQDDFVVSSDDGLNEYRVYYSYLRVVRLALEALVKAGVSEIEQPDVIPPESLPVADNEGEMVCVYHGVEIGVRGSYASILKVLELVQVEGSFLQARLSNLRAVGSRDAEERLLRGSIVFFGFALVEPSEDTSEGSGRTRGRGKRRRKR
jgi:hypothetical protein